MTTNPRTSILSNDMIKKYYDKCIEAPGANMMPRAQQLAFAADIARTIDGDFFSFLESKTGTGKTVAYLLAAAIAIENNGEKKVTIATPKKHLQQEIVDTFERHIKPLFPEMSIALLKGKVNYISPAVIEAEKLQVQADEHLTDEEKETRREELEHFHEYVDAMEGDMDLVETTNPALIPKFINDLSSFAISAGTRGEVDLYYYRRAKDRAQDAQIIVTNHAMLIMSAMIATDANPGLLPVSNLIIDEAHSFISAAYNALHDSVAIRTVEENLHHIKVMTAIMRGSAALKFRGVKTVVNTLENAISETREIRESITSIGGAILGARNGNGNGYRTRVIHMRDYGRSNPVLDTKIRAVKAYIAELSRTLSATRKVLSKYRKNLEKMGGMENFLEKLFEAADTVRKMSTREHGEKSYHYLSLSKERGYPSVGTARYNINGWLAGILWSKVKSAVLTSGTIADESSTYAPESDAPGNVRLAIKYNHIEIELGLHISVKPSRIYKACAYTPHFRWENVVVHLYKSAPLFEADENGNVRAAKFEIFAFAAPHITDALARVHGGGLMLVPAYEDASLFVERDKENHIGRDLIVQRPLVSTRSYVERHKKNPGGNLLVLVSGWEGLDLPGDQLTSLFIPRIPHGSPDDPVYVARRSAKRKSKSAYVAFRTEELWRFRQGIGRLLRTEDDHGEIHIFDRRVVADPGHSAYKAFIDREFGDSSNGKQKIIIHDTVPGGIS